MVLAAQHTCPPWGTCACDDAAANRMGECEAEAYEGQSTNCKDKPAEATDAVASEAMDMLRQLHDVLASRNTTNNVVNVAALNKDFIHNTVSVYGDDVTRD